MTESRDYETRRTRAQSLVLASDPLVGIGGLDCMKSAIQKIEILDMSKESTKLDPFFPQRIPVDGHNFRVASGHQ